MSIIPAWLDPVDGGTYTGPLKCSLYRVCRRNATVKHYPKCHANARTVEHYFLFCDECSDVYPFPPVKLERLGR